MKFTAFVFVASLCLVAVTAKVIEDRAAHFEGIIGISIKCGYEEVPKVRYDTQLLIDKVKSCKLGNDETTQQLIESFNDIVVLANNISDAYKIHCQGDERTSQGCTGEVMGQIIAFYEKLKEVARLVHEASGNVNECVWDAVKAIPDYVIQSSRHVGICIINSMP